MKFINHSNHSKLDFLIVGQGHTIMAGYVPSVIKPEEFSENFYKWSKISKESVEKLGFFGSDIDYNTYYPDLKAEDLKPKDDEFIEPMFRLLSATIVSKNYNPTDFSAPGVLKASMKMLLGQTVNCDHSTDIGNAIGSVSQVIWQEAYKEGNFTIPAGINGVLKIDGKANPRIARGILMDPPSIHSNSVTVQFKWDKSHPELDDREFYEKLGTYDAKGNMVRRMVTEVVRYLETSLVSHGADTFAQKIGSDGKIINPDFAKRTWSSYSEYNEDRSKNFYFFDYKSDINSYQENNDTTELNNINISQTNKLEDTDQMDLQEFLQTLVGAGLIQLEEGTELTADFIRESVRTLVSSQTTLSERVTNLETEKTTLSEQITNLNTQVANLQAMATVGTNYIAELREKVVGNYKKLNGDSVDETIVNMIQADTTGLQTLISLNKDYEVRLEEKFPLTCKSCGSHDVNRSSAMAEGNTKVETGVKSNSEVFQEIYNAKIK